MNHLRILFVALGFLFAPLLAHAQAKPGVVLLPIQGEGLSRADRDYFRGALVEALALRYKVFSGDDVDKKLQQIARKTCNDEKCLQELSIHYQAQFIGRGVINKEGEGWLILVELRDAFSDEVELSSTKGCPRCDKLGVIEALKSVVGGGAVASAQPVAAPAAATAPFAVTRDCVDCPEMVSLPAGSFDMGSDESSSEQPVHRVTVPAFAIGKTEVTQAQWTAVMGSNPSHFKGCDTCPVEHMTWDEIQAFLQKLSAKAGKRYALPSEAEWEYACRAGGRHKYCGSDQADAVAWFELDLDGKTRPVGQRQANAFGLHDMSGNVREWVADCWNKNYAGAPTDGSAWMSGACEQRVARGGAWFGTPGTVSATVRLGYDMAKPYFLHGFRVVVSPGRRR